MSPVAGMRPAGFHPCTGSCCSHSNIRAPPPGFTSVILPSPQQPVVYSHPESNDSVLPVNIVMPVSVRTLHWPTIYFKKLKFSLNDII